MKKLALMIPLLIIGCGPAVIDVTGTVSFNGKPVVYGTVVVIGSDGIPKNATIAPDGTFRLEGIKPGPVRIAVTSPKPPGLKRSGEKTKADDDGLDGRRPADANDSVDPKVRDGWMELPDRYGFPDTSGLETEIEKGKELNLDLKP
jgi:hypothetical protein